MTRGRGGHLFALACAVWTSAGCFAGCDDEGGAPPASPEAGVVVPPERARLVSSRGEVALTRGGTTAPAQPGPLRLMDILETGKASGAEIQFPGGRSISVGENARLTLDEQEGARVLVLAQGAVLSRVPADAPGGGTGLQVLIQTPYGLTRLSQGPQEVEVAVDGDEGRVNVVLGRIELIDKTGKVIAAQEGERLELSGGKVELIGRTPAEKLPLTLETIQVVIQAGGGAEVKPKGAARWRKVAPKGETLPVGSSVRTSRRAPARFTLGARSSLELSPSGEVTIAESVKRGARGETKLELKKGRLIHLARVGSETAIALPDVAVAGDGKGTRFELRREGAGVVLHAVAGDLNVTREGGEDKVETVRAGTRLLLKPGAAAAPSPLEPAALRLPTRNGQRVFHPGIPEVQLSWPGDAGDYEVVVAEDAAFEQPILEGRVHAPGVKVPAPRRGAIFWKTKGAGGEELKGSAFFAPEGSATDLKRLRNEVPDGAEKTTIFYQDKPPAVTFTFNPVENAARYKLAVFKLTELKAPIAERETSETRVSLAEGALAEGSYVWSMTATAANGVALPNRGRMNKLEMVYDNAVPGLVILSPRNGESARGPVAARGIAPLGSRVYINGKAVALDEKGRFDTPAFPQGSPPVIIFKLSRPGEADSVMVRVLQ